MALVGQEVVNRLFDGASQIGRDIRIGGVRFQVIGVLNVAGGGSPGGVSDDTTILVPITTAQTRLGSDRTLTGEYPVSNIMRMRTVGATHGSPLQETSPCA